MKSNSDKCHLIVAENEHRPSYISNSGIYLDEERTLLQSEELVKLLGVWIDNKLTFEEHIKTLLKKAAIFLFHACPISLSPLSLNIHAKIKVMSF